MIVNSLPSGLVTLNDRTPKSLISVGLSMKYWKFGAVKTNGSLGRKQLRRDLPVTASRLDERDANRTHVETHAPT